MQILKTSIVTSLGQLGFSVDSEFGDLSNSEIRLTRVLSLHSSALRANEGVIAVLSVHSPTVIEGLRFVCTWHKLFDKQQCSSTYLKVQNCADNKQHLVIGTEDGECLASRFRPGGVSQDNYSVSKQKHAINIKVGCCPANENFTLHFVILQNSIPEHEEGTCWYAVDVTGDKLVEVPYTGSSLNQLRKAGSPTPVLSKPPSDAITWPVT